MRIRVLIVDDHAVLRAGLRLLINAQSDMEVVGEAADGAEALPQVRKSKPDVILLDLSMPGQGGLSVMTRLRQAAPRAKILVLTMYDDPAYYRAAIDAGATGYLVKTSADTELLKAIRAVHTGAEYVDRTLAGGPTQPERGRKSLRAGRTAGRMWGAVKPLSVREHEVLDLLAHGYTNREAADRLRLSVKSVETYRARLLEKLGLRSRAELIRYALDSGLLKPSKQTARG